MSSRHLPRHARTGLLAAGWRKPRRGESGPQPIWPVMGGSQPTGEPPNATPPAAEPPKPGPPSSHQPTGPATGPNGYPENTPVAEMTDAQAASYWRHQSRKHEDAEKAAKNRLTELEPKAKQYDDLAAASQTEQERAVKAAREEGVAAGRAEYLPAALRYEVALEKGLPKTLADRLQGSTRDEMAADADALLKLIPAAADTKPPADLGQGRREQTSPTGLAAGEAAYRQRHAPPPTT